jgi:hypothetical protein
MIKQPNTWQIRKLWAKEFWKSAGPLTAINPKYVAFLEVIDYRTILLKNTQ